MDADTLQTGMRSSDGGIVAGEGEATLDTDGLTVLESTISRFRFVTSGNLRSADITKGVVGAISFRSDTDIRIESGVDIGSGGSTGANVALIAWDTGVADTTYDATRLDFLNVNGQPRLRIGRYDSVNTLFFASNGASTTGAVLSLADAAGTPSTSSPDATENGRLYYINGKMVFQTWCPTDTDDIRYLYWNADDGSSDWIVSTTAPT